MTFLSKTVPFPSVSMSSRGRTQGQEGGTASGAWVCHPVLRQDWAQLVKVVFFPEPQTHPPRRLEEEKESHRKTCEYTSPSALCIADSNSMQTALEALNNPNPARSLTISAVGSLQNLTSVGGPWRSPREVLGSTTSINYS